MFSRCFFWVVNEKYAIFQVRTERGDGRSWRSAAGYAVLAFVSRVRSATVPRPVARLSGIVRPQRSLPLPHQPSGQRRFCVRHWLVASWRPEDQSTRARRSTPGTVDRIALRRRLRSGRGPRHYLRRRQSSHQSGSGSLLRPRTASWAHLQRFWSCRWVPYGHLRHHAVANGLHWRFRTCGARRQGKFGRAFACFLQF